jgi:mycothiol synthase
MAPLGAEVDRARAAGDLLASSDPSGAFVMKAIALDPRLAGGAFADGDLVGFVSPEFKVVVVRPSMRRQGIGRALAGLASELEHERGRPDVILGVLPGAEGSVAFLEAIGLAYHSTVWDLDLPADRPVPGAVWPAGLKERSFDRERDPAAWITLFNEAFADHATPLQLDETFMTAALDDPDVDDADTRLVEDAATGELVAFCSADVRRVNGVVPSHVEIWAIGVRPARQGAGIGRQLLRAGVTYLRGIGVPVVSLSVNGRNEGALRLYESEGFVRMRTRDRWFRPVEPPDAPE